MSRGALPDPSGSGLLESMGRWRCLYLLIAITALMGLYPYLGEVPFDLLFSAVMVLGLYSVSRSRGQFAAVALLLVPAMIGNWATFGEERRDFELVLSVATAAFFGVMAVLVLHYVFVGYEQMGDRLCGALSVYLLMGLGFAQVYHAIWTVDPGAFTFARPVDAEAFPEGRFLYLSFVTQTTMGYGDITPRNLVTESLTILQATTGVLYVAVLVAWLVSQIRPEGEESE